MAGCTHPEHKQYLLNNQGADICLCTQCGRVAWVLYRGRQHSSDRTGPQKGVPVEVALNERIPFDAP